MDNKIAEEDNKSRSSNNMVKEILSEFSDEDIFGERINSEDKLKHDSFVIKNGCCRDCMKAFSKSGKSCLCQVPKAERNFVLPEKGCHFCSCKGCNPIDVRKEQRRDLKRNYRENKNFQYKRERLLSSDDEDLKVYSGLLFNKQN